MLKKNIRRCWPNAANAWGGLKRHERPRLMNVEREKNAWKWITCASSPFNKFHVSLKTLRKSRIYVESFGLLWKRFPAFGAFEGCMKSSYNLNTHTTIAFMITVALYCIKLYEDETWYSIESSLSNADKNVFQLI